MNEVEWFMFTSVLLAWWKAKQAAKAEANKWQEDKPVNGTDFQGDMWARLDGYDLLTYERNIANSMTADPGKVGQSVAGFTPNWNGNL
jgi:hypothetical protein